MTDYLAPLNEEQRQAVEALDGPLLVLAGAGTGKTRVLTTRFAHILLSKKAFPNQVLAVTFTNKAAREMRERVAAILGQPAEGLWLGTFHALCARMLRRHAEHAGLSANFTILDSDDQLRLLKQVMDAARIDTKRWTPGSVMSLIQRWKDRGLTPARTGVEAADDQGTSLAREIYAAYQARLLALNAADFGDLILHVTEILRPSRISSRNIIVTFVTFWWTNTRTPIWCNISGFGCWPRAIATFVAWATTISRFTPGAVPRWKIFCGSKKISRARRSSGSSSNYRSTAPILAAASTLIAHNTGRLGKTLRVGRKDAGSGEKVSVVGLWDSDEEARMVGERIERYRRDGHPLSEIAVLVRAGFQTRAFEERLIVLGVPYRVVGGLRFYERQEIRDAIAYMRAMTRPADDLAFERIVNVPRRGVGDSGDCVPCMIWRAPRDCRCLARRHAWSKPAASRAKPAVRWRICFVDWRPGTACWSATGMSLRWRRCLMKAATPRCGSRTNPPRRRAGWRTCANWCARWRTLRPSMASSIMSRW